MSTKDKVKYIGFTVIIGFIALVVWAMDKTEKDKAILDANYEFVGCLMESTNPEDCVLADVAK